MNNSATYKDSNMSSVLNECKLFESLETNMICVKI